MIEPVAALTSGPLEPGDIFPWLGTSVTGDPWRETLELLDRTDGKVVFAAGIPTGEGTPENVWLARWSDEGTGALSQSNEERVLRAALAHSAADRPLTDVPPSVLAAVAFDAFHLHDYSLLHLLFADDLRLFFVALPPYLLGRARRSVRVWEVRRCRHGSKPPVT